MAKLKNITELDLGETLIIQGEKVHVNIDGATIVAENGVLKAVLPEGSPITKFELSPTGTLSLGVKGVEQPFTVDLTGLVPAAQADRFLSGVTFNKTKKAFVFTTSKDGEADQKFEVPLSAFLDEVLKISSDEGNILELREDGLYVACCGGADLSDVPEKPFEQGSKVLAFDADGNLYQFAQNAAYEKDVAVAINVTKNNILDNGDNVATVEVVVSNNLPTAAEDVVLSVGTAATILSGNTQETLSLDGNSQRVFTYEVQYSTSSYFTANVNVVGDVVSSNNSASVALPFNQRVQSASQNNVYTEDCPEITATYLGQALKLSSQVGTVDLNAVTYATNIIADRNIANLNGLELKLQGAKRVQVYADKTLLTNWYDRNLSSYRYAVNRISASEYEAFLVDTSVGKEVNTAEYTFDENTGALRFTQPFTSAIIFARPEGENCKWQVVKVVCEYRKANHTYNSTVLADTSLPEYQLVTEGVPTNNIDYGSKPHKAYDELDSVAAVLTTNDNVLGQDLTSFKHTGNSGYWNSLTMYSYVVPTTWSQRQKLEIELCRDNLPITFQVYTESQIALTRGAITVTESEYVGVYNVTVQANATSTANYRSGPVAISIGDQCIDSEGGTYNFPSGSRYLRTKRSSGGISYEIEIEDEE